MSRTQDRKPSVRCYIPAIALALAAASLCTFSAQEGDLSIETVRSNTYKPKKLPATDARVRSLRLQDGFSVHVFAEGLDNPRMIAVSAEGAVYVTQRTPGNLVLLKDMDGDGIADVQRIVATVPGLHGIALREGRIYLADVKNIYVGEVLSDGAISPLTKIASDLPDGGQHPNRTLAFGPDGVLYLSVGSDCNACLETTEEIRWLQSISSRTEAEMRRWRANPTTSPSSWCPKS